MYVYVCVCPCASVWRIYNFKKGTRSPLKMHSLRLWYAFYFLEHVNLSEKGGRLSSGFANGNAKCTPPPPPPPPYILGISFYVLCLSFKPVNSISTPQVNQVNNICATQINDFRVPHVWVKCFPPICFYLQLPVYYNGHTSVNTIHLEKTVRQLTLTTCVLTFTKST